MGGSSYSKEDIIKAGNLGQRRSGLQKSTACSNGFFKGPDGYCYPSPGTKLAGDWQWQDDHSVKGMEDYYDLDAGSKGNVTERYQSGPQQGYLITRLDCESEGGVWIDKASDTFGKNWGWDDAPSAWGGSCALRKGTLPSFYKAAAIDNEKQCKESGYKWWSPVLGKDYCYYEIPKDGTYTGTGSDLNHVINNTDEIVTNIKNDALEGFDAVVWLSDHMPLVIGGIAFIVLFPYIKDSIF